MTLMAVQMGVMAVTEAMVQEVIPITPIITTIITEMV